MIISVLTYKLLVLSFLTAKRQLIHNRTAQRTDWNHTYDFIIVGGGASGCVVANRLSEDPNVTVLLLEAGGAQDAIYNDVPPMWSSIANDRPDLDWFYYSEPDQFSGRRIGFNMGRSLGGSASHNDMVFFRPQQRDYNNWVQTYGAKGWGFKEVLPFLRRFENNTDWNVVNRNPGYHGINGPVQITTPRVVDPINLLNIRMFNQEGYLNTDVNGKNQTGTMIAQSYIGLNGFRSGAANSYVDPNPHPNNLHIVTRAQVIRILFNRTTAIGVEFNRLDTDNRVYARREVILSAGPFQTPQLLMLSGIGPRDNLQSYGIPVVLDLPVGSDIISIPNLIISSNVSSNLTNAAPELSLYNLDQLFFNQSGPLSRFAQVLVYRSTIYNLDREWPNSLIRLSVLNGQINYLVLLLRVKSRGWASLQSSSPYIPLKFDPNSFSVDSDIQNMMDALSFLLACLEMDFISQYVTLPTFESVGCPSCPGRYMYECTEGLRCYVLTQYGSISIARTCPMGAVDRSDVVVDPLLRVKNCQNLRICDTSILPDTMWSNAQALMIGERCSQFIKECYYLK